MLPYTSRTMHSSDEQAAMLLAQPPQSPFLSYWMTLQTRLRDVSAVSVDGRTLDIPSIVAVARHGKTVAISPESLEGLQAAVDGIQAKLSKGEIIYGINTGFGGSASSRPSQTSRVQDSLMRMLNYGILADNFPTDPSIRSIDEHGSTTSMPEAWVRAAMAIRMNSLVKGASGIRPVLVQNLADALNHDIVPQVPLRGSISASGDLSPLSYIGSMLQGKASIRVHAGKGSSRRLMNADSALRLYNITPVVLEPKEGLAIVNGTAISSAVSALAMFEAHSLAAFSQVLCAMSVESLRGSLESFDPFLAQMRPHPGQIEASDNIRHFLSGTRMAINCAQREDTQQDRYAIRTSSQWIGPVLEDFALADRQLHIEVNSVTDNPLVTPDSRMLHGGNFQAKAVTSAMEKVRQGCESLGQMLFSQCTELMNPSTSNGLPPNLVVDSPQESWLWKGIDIMAASLASELGFLANSVGSNVKSAEMGNQSLNSLALVSARYTMTALDILTQLAAVHTLACCQAMDLRALHDAFMLRLHPRFTALTHDHLAEFILPHSKSTDLETLLWTGFRAFLKSHTSMAPSTCMAAALDELGSTVLKSCVHSVEMLDALDAWKISVGEVAGQLYVITLSEYVKHPDATPLLGAASHRVYAFVRHDLRIPFVYEKYLEEAEKSEMVESEGGRYKSLGAMVTALYASMKSGAFWAVVAACHADAAQACAKEMRKEARASKL